MAITADLFEQIPQSSVRVRSQDLTVDLFRAHALQDVEVKAALLKTRLTLGVREGPKYLLEVFATKDASVTCYGLAKPVEIHPELYFKTLPLTSPEVNQQNTETMCLERLITFDEFTDAALVGRVDRRGYKAGCHTTLAIQEFLTRFTVVSHWKIFL